MLEMIRRAQEISYAANVPTTLMPNELGYLIQQIDILQARLNNLEVELVAIQAVHKSELYTLQTRLNEAKMSFEEAYSWIDRAYPARAKVAIQQALKNWSK